MIFYCLVIIFLTISSVENNQIDSPKSDSKEDHSAPDDVTKLSKELQDSRLREKDLNQTIQDILEEMSQMKNTILHLEETIEEVASEATRNTKHIEDNADDIVNVAETITLVNTSLKEDVSFISSQIYKVNATTNQLIEDNKRDIEDNQRFIEENTREIEDNMREIVENKRKIENNTRDIEDNKSQIGENQKIITELSLAGQWCGYKSGWTGGSGVITYDTIFEDSSMNNSALNPGSGETLEFQEN